ncbi:MAG: T9SS type A sorting domain-containing protein, partial [Bacteroidota bacterium]
FEFTVYPNPTSNYFNIFPFPQGSKIKVFNTSGQQVFESEQIGPYSLDLPKGIYFVNIRSGNSNTIRKLLIQ